MRVNVDNKDTVKIFQLSNLVSVAEMRKDFKEETVQTESGEQIVISANVERVELKTRANLLGEVLSNFDYYWSLGLSSEIKSIKSKLLTKIKTLLASTDYKQAKWKDGAMTDADYEPIKAKRASWRAAYNAVENAATIAEINTITILAE